MANPKKALNLPINARTRPQDVAVVKYQDIVNQGRVPLKDNKEVPIPAAPKGEQTARGFGAMLRPQKYTVS
jgi:hypothetical protein